MNSYMNKTQSNIFSVSDKLKHGSIFNVLTIGFVFEL
jgi:hypothetical protein